MTTENFGREEVQEEGILIQSLKELFSKIQLYRDHSD